MTTVWIVQQDTYESQRIDSVWDKEADATARHELLTSLYDVPHYDPEFDVRPWELNTIPNELPLSHRENQDWRAARGILKPKVS